jgi:hypothetical protein
VIGYTVGGGAFDALVFGYYDGAELIYVARTRNGFAPCEALFHRNPTRTCEARFRVARRHASDRARPESGVESWGQRSNVGVGVEIARRPSEDPTASVFRRKIPVSGGEAPAR